MGLTVSRKTAKKGCIGEILDKFELLEIKIFPFSNVSSCVMLP